MLCSEVCQKDVKYVNNRESAGLAYLKDMWWKRETRK